MDATRRRRCSRLRPTARASASSCSRGWPARPSSWRATSRGTARRPAVTRRCFTPGDAASLERGYHSRARVRETTTTLAARSRHAETWSMARLMDEYEERYERPATALFEPPSSLKYMAPSNDRVLDAPTSRATTVRATWRRCSIPTGRTPTRPRPRAPHNQRAVRRFAFRRSLPHTIIVAVGRGRLLSSASSSCRGCPPSGWWWRCSTPGTCTGRCRPTPSAVASLGARCSGAFNGAGDATERLRLVTVARPVGGDLRRGPRVARSSCATSGYNAALVPDGSKHFAVRHRPR